jgi:Cu-processing system permease protein
VVATWFLLVFFYDLGLLGLLVATDGAVSSTTVAALVIANPAGLFRLQMMTQFAGPAVLENLGMTIVLPSSAGIAAMWTAWIAAPVLLSGLLLSRQKVSR